MARINACSSTKCFVTLYNTLAKVTSGFNKREAGINLMKVIFEQIDKSYHLRIEPINRVKHSFTTKDIDVYFHLEEDFKQFVSLNSGLYAISVSPCATTYTFCSTFNGRGGIPCSARSAT